MTGREETSSTVNTLTMSVINVKIQLEHFKSETDLTLLDEQSEENLQSELCQVATIKSWRFIFLQTTDVYQISMCDTYHTDNFHIMCHITITFHVYEREFISGAEVGWRWNNSWAMIRDGVSSMKPLDIFKEILGNFGIFLTSGQVVCVFFNKVLGHFRLCLWPKYDVFPTPVQWVLSLKPTRQTPVYKTVFLKQLDIFN